MTYNYTHNTGISCEIVLGIEDDLDDGNIPESEHYKYLCELAPQDVVDNFLSWFGQQSIEKYINYTKEKAKINSNIFKDAKFKDEFLLRDDRTAIYHKAEHHKGDRKDEIWHYLILEPTTKEEYAEFGEPFIYAPYECFVNKNGKGYPENLKLYDLEDPNCPNYNNVIVSRK